MRIHVGCSLLCSSSRIWTNISLWCWFLHGGGTALFFLIPKWQSVSESKSSKASIAWPPPIWRGRGRPVLLLPGCVNLLLLCSAFRVPFAVHECFMTYDVLRKSWMCCDPPGVFHVVQPTIISLLFMSCGTVGSVQCFRAAKNRRLLRTYRLNPFQTSRLNFQYLPSSWYSPRVPPNATPPGNKAFINGLWRDHGGFP